MQTYLGYIINIEMLQTVILFVSSDGKLEMKPHWISKFNRYLSIGSLRSLVFICMFYPLSDLCVSKLDHTWY